MTTTKIGPMTRDEIRDQLDEARAAWLSRSAELRRSMDREEGLRAEVERLTRERDCNLRGVTNAMRAGGEACDDLHAEIEQLLATVDNLRAQLAEAWRERNDARSTLAAVRDAADD